MTKRKRMVDLEKLHKDTFRNTFDSMQLLNLTVLYYNFDFSKDDLKTVGDIYIKNNNKLDNIEWTLMMEAKIYNILGYSIKENIKKFPCRSLSKMMRVHVTGNIHNITTIYDIAMNSIYSLCLLVLDTMIHDYNWGKEEIELWWENIILNADNYKNGMTDHFIADYFRDQIDLDITHGDDKI